MTGTAVQGTPCGAGRPAAAGAGGGPASPAVGRSPEARLRGALTGVLGLLVTPFDAKDRPEPARLAPVIARCVAAGVDALVVNGEAGEWPSLGLAEAERMQAELPVLLAGRAVLLAGLGGSLPVACALARRARGDGADAVLLHLPAGPFVAPRGLVAHAARVAEAAGLPMVIELRQDGIGLPAIEALCRIPGVVALAWATPGLMALGAAMQRAGPETGFLCGLGEAWAPPMAALGVRGFTSSLANLLPAVPVALRDALRAGDLAAAHAAIAGLAGFAALQAEEQGGAHVAVLKAALGMLGEEMGAARPPAAWPLPPGSLARLRSLLEARGLIRQALRQGAGR